MIEPQLWDDLKRQIEQRFQVPDFAFKVLAKSWHSIEAQDLVSEETNSLDASYLAFLDEQIELEPRGEEWSAVLKNRRNELSPYVGRMLTTLTVSTSHGRMVIKFCPQDNRIVLFEALSL